MTLLRAALVIALVALAGVALPPVRSLTVHLVPHTHDDVGWLNTVSHCNTTQHNTAPNAEKRRQTEGQKHD